MIEFMYLVTLLDPTTGVTRTGMGVIDVDVNARRHEVISYAIDEANAQAFGRRDADSAVLFMSVEPNERAL